VVGLIDSHKQGTGLRTRVKVYFDTVANKWKVGVEDDAGTTRDNLRLRYGELVQGYRVVPFGSQWSSVSNIIGRNLNSAQVFYKSASSPGIDTAIWGRFDSVQILNNIDDANDLQRRAKQLAVHAAKLGKQVGLGIRSGLLLPRNGYDVCDALPVQIQHGVVDTDRFGSGYWVVYGIAWEGGDDGSSTVILTLLPQEDSEAPDEDLIPSAPISTQAEWQVGWVPPDPLIVSSKYWVDQTTGKVYQRDESGASPVYDLITDANILPDVPSARRTFAPPTSRLSGDRQGAGNDRSYRHVGDHSRPAGRCDGHGHGLRRGRVRAGVHPRLRHGGHAGRAGHADRSDR
jgi:hypothetical protein